MESRLILLGLLSAGPGHGYDLKRSWDHWFAASKPLAYGQVYATLARLVRDGLITQIETEPGAGPERKRYEVTDAGRQSVEQWLLTPVAPAGDVQADIFAKTVIALMLDDDAGRLLDLQRAEHMARMRELTRLKQDGDLRTVLLADHALFHIEADLRWMETTAARLGEAHPPGEVIMRARGLEMSFGRTHALRGVDLDLLAGEVLAVTGPSGSGKSTLLHVMAGVLVPDAGSVSYHGGKSPGGGATDVAEDIAVNIAVLDEAARSRLRLNEFGFIFQFGQLLPDLSALDNVTIPLLLAGASRRKALAQARETLGELGLSEHLDKRPTQLSGGQAQRAAVARALVTNPHLLFADEPTGSLDSLAAERTMEVLLNSVRSRGAGLVIITHDARIAAYADREVTVRDGRIGPGATHAVVGPKEPGHAATGGRS